MAAEAEAAPEAATAHQSPLPVHKRWARDQQTNSREGSWQKGWTAKAERHREMVESETTKEMAEKQG